MSTSTESRENQELSLSAEEQELLRAELSSWDFFVLRHTKTPNLIVHFVSFIIYWSSPVLALATWDWRWLFGLPLSGIVAGPAHYLFDDGGINVKEATFSPQVVFYVTIMFWRIAQGSYWGDIETAKGRYAELKARLGREVSA